MQRAFHETLIAYQLVGKFTTSYATQNSLLPQDEEKYGKAFECRQMVIFRVFKTFSVLYSFRRFGGT
jgi:hypothetical protein